MRLIVQCLQHRVCCNQAMANGERSQPDISISLRRYVEKACSSCLGSDFFVGKGSIIARCFGLGWCFLDGTLLQGDMTSELRIVGISK